MADLMSPADRSALMSRVRGKDTGPELEIRRRLWHSGFRYRLHGAGLPGRPDLVLSRWNTVVFVHGCFWHRHEDCEFFRLPKTRSEFWDQKLCRNAERDAQAIAALRRLGWRVAVVWECALRASEERSGAALERWLLGSNGQIEIRAKSRRVSARTRR